MFVSTNKCQGLGECIKECPTEAIRLINGKSFSCISCGICYENCPNHAIFKNKYGGYVVDRAKCNGCGFCKYNCPINNITISDDGIVKGICARCGVCVDACPSDSRINGFELIKDKQINYLKSLDIALPSYDRPIKSKSKEVSRLCVETNLDNCTLCGRCEYYCPTKAIDVKVDHYHGICTKCNVCSDVCPTGAIKNNIIDHEKCRLCLNCIKHCPNDAIILDDFEVNINKLSQDNTGYIISCLNCGLCVDNSQSDALKQVDGKIKYDISKDLGKDIKSIYKKSIEQCPVSTLKESKVSIPIKDQVQNSSLSGYCTLCGNCVKVCEHDGRSVSTVTWDGKADSNCISCGTCSEVCPKDAITIKRNGIIVDYDKCILCESCAIYCPTNSIKKSTLAKKIIVDGYNEIDKKLCMYCKLCYKICPEEAIIDNGDSMTVDQSKCTNCGACYNACPARAFIFEREFVNSNESQGV